MELVIAILGSGALSALISGVFTAVNNYQNNKKEKNDGRFKRLEVDIVRTQLLLLLSDYPSNVAEIMKVAEHYFSDLKGDWYMTSLFFDWLQENEIAEPAWFDNKM